MGAGRCFWDLIGGNEQLFVFCFPLAMCLAVNVHLVTESIGLKSPGRGRENILLKLLKDLHWP
jgi:hypothetical protein